MQHQRPNPDDLLRAVTREQEKRGKLKVFLGASAGVGKTYAMLSEAHERRTRGVDVVIGYAETHGRSETQSLLDGLEQVPLKEIDYRGSILRELDVEAIIKRKPTLVVVDELAHTNAPGSRHLKRWQDIEEILDAGINVFTAVNIQHLETLNDVVAQITGVRVQETVPDAFFDQASDIELIDIPPAELQQRLKEGKVYIPERIETALGGFFKTSNLTALRELALRRAADAVDAEMQRLRFQEGTQKTWVGKERVIVCVAPNRLASRVVRSAARLGSASHAELIAVYVESDRQTSRPAGDHNAARDALELAAQLGMEVVGLSGHDIVTEVIDFANRRNATLIVVGKPIRPRWKEVIFGSVVDELVRQSGDIDVHVITADSGEQIRKAAPRLDAQSITAGGVAWIAATTAFSTGLGFLLLDGFGIANVAMAYMFGVTLCAMRCTKTESAISAVASVLSFNFFFVEPRYTFAVSDARYILLFLVMLSVGLVISTLTSRLRDQLKASSERERRTTSLYALSRQLSQGRAKRDMAQSAAREIRGVFDADVAVYMREGNDLALLAPSDSGFETSPNEKAVAAWSAEHGEPAGLGTDTLPGAAAYYLPLRGAESLVGLLAFKPIAPFVEQKQRQLLETFGNALGLALERAILAKASNDARVIVESERIRNTLLSSISHDLRTPLTTITGAASTLLQGAGDPKELASTIYTESVRLNHQIQNLLDMTRIQTGNVQPDLEWHAVDELVASALRHAQPSLGQRQIEVATSPNLPLLKVDGLLIEKALVNLFENVGRHTGPNDRVKVSSEVRGNQMKISVQDTGPGLPDEELHALFEPGYRTRAGGYGLGLAVVKAVMDIHGGDVSAGNASGGGAIFTLTLPITGDQPKAPHE